MNEAKRLMGVYHKATERGIIAGLEEAFDDLTEVHVEHNRRGRCVVAARHPVRGPDIYAEIYLWLREHTPVGIEWHVQLVPTKEQEDRP